MSKRNTSKKGLRIIIVGCGKVGITLTEQLAKEGHDITLIDKNAQKLQSTAGMYDVMGVVGNGASYSVQEEAGIASANLIIAVTDSDELNLLCCTIAKRVGNCAAIARVRTPDYSQEAGYMPTALEVNSFAHGQAELVKFKIPKCNCLDGMTIAALGKEMNVPYVICVIERGGYVHIPTGRFVMHADDTISFVASRKSTKIFLEHIGFKTNQVKDTMIIGGGSAIRSGISVKIIENSRERCEELSILLPKAVIINGDGTDEELLKEEGITEVESFVPLTGIDEENIMLTLHAKQVSNAKVITKINRITFKNVINSLDLGSVIYPKYITSEAIIAYVRAKNDSMESNDSNSGDNASASDSTIETLYHMFDHRVEAIEFRVTKSSDVTGKPLAELKLKDEILISFINRNGTIIIPSGQDCILEGDTVMIVTTHTGFTDIQDILR